MSTDTLTNVFYVLAIVLATFMIVDMIIDKITRHYLNKRIKKSKDALAEVIEEIESQRNGSKK